jgi:MFS family permease
LYATSASFVLGFILCAQVGFPEWRLFLWAGLLIYGLTLMNTPNMAIYATVVGNDGSGLFVGIFETCNGVAQISGPIAAAAAFKMAGGSHNILLGILAAPLVLCWLLLPLAWSQLNKHPVDSDEQEPVQENEHKQPFGQDAGGGEWLRRRQQALQEQHRQMYGTATPPLFVDS